MLGSLEVHAIVNGWPYAFTARDWICRVCGTSSDAVVGEWVKVSTCARGGPTRTLIVAVWAPFEARTVVRPWLTAVMLPVAPPPFTCAMPGLSELTVMAGPETMLPDELY